MYLGPDLGSEVVLLLMSSKNTLPATEKLEELLKSRYELNTLVSLTVKSV